MFDTDGVAGSTSAPTDAGTGPSEITATVAVAATTTRSRLSRIVPFPACGTAILAGNRPGQSRESPGVHVVLSVVARHRNGGTKGVPCQQGAPGYHRSTLPFLPRSPVSSPIVWEYQ